MADLSQEQLDKHIAWMRTRYGKWSSSTCHSMMAGIDDPVLIDADRLPPIVDILNKMGPATFGKTGLPSIKDVRIALENPDFTVDEFKYAWKMREGEKPSEGMVTYARKKAVESLTEYNHERELKLPQIIWGNINEVAATELFVKRHNLKVINTGDDQVCQVYDEDCGSTPDGLVVDSDGEIIATIETKCPGKDTHAHYMCSITDGPTLRKQEPKYYWQVQDQLRCHNLNMGYFVSYDPDWPDPDHQFHSVIIHRNEKDIASIEHRLGMCRKERDAYIATINQATTRLM